MKVTLGRLEEGEKLTEVAAAPEPGTGTEPKSVEVLGMKIASLNDELRKKYNIGAQVQGVVVLSVDENSAAFEKRIEAGDVITEADQRPALNPQDVTERVKEIEGARQGLHPSAGVEVFPAGRAAFHRAEAEEGLIGSSSTWPG